jgi:hypothetical protein
MTGVAGGAALATAVSYGKPSARRVGGTLAAAVLIAVACAVPLHGIPDIRPELARVVANEDRTAAAYQTAVERFKSGRTTAEALAQLIRRNIMPELQATRTRLNALERVPDVHQPLVTSAQEYLRLRDESWRMRAEGLDKGSMGRLREADQRERASLQALQLIRTPDQK